MTLDAEGVVDCTVGRNEPLGLTLGLEPLHFSLPSSDRQMRILRPIVIPQSPRPMAILAPQNLHRRSV